MYFKITTVYFQVKLYTSHIVWNLTIILPSLSSQPCTYCHTLYSTYYKPYNYFSFEWSIIFKRDSNKNKSILLYLSFPVLTLFCRYKCLFDIIFLLPKGLPLTFFYSSVLLVRNSFFFVLLKTIFISPSFLKSSFC